MISSSWPDGPLSVATTTIDDCRVVQLSKIHNGRSGNLTVVQPGANFPFEIKRAYYLYDVPSGATRGGHAHRQLYQLLVAASGSIEVVLDDGENKRTVFMNRPDVGLLVVPGIWRELQEFSSGAICLVMASESFDEADYIRTYAAFENVKNEKTGQASVNFHD